MPTIEELEARIAALELVTSFALNRAGRAADASAWPTRADAQADEAVAELQDFLSCSSATEAAAASIRKMFDRSKRPWPPDVEAVPSSSTRNAE